MGVTTVPGKAFPIKPAKILDPMLGGAITTESSSASESTSSDACSADAGSSDFGADSYQQVCAQFQDSLWIVPVASTRGKNGKIHSVVDETPEKYVTECNKRIGLSAERLVGWGDVLLSSHAW